MSLSPRKVAVTGAAGQIGYALIFRIAAGGLFGENTPVRLSLIETPNAKTFLDGVEMELLDCAFPLLVGIDKTADPETGFADADAVFLIGARPRSAGMERKDLLEANAEIFSTQGRALQRAACATTRVLVVGNPANTNCLIARANAPALPDQNWSAMTRWTTTACARCSPPKPAPPWARLGTPRFGAIILRLNFPTFFTPRSTANRPRIWRKASGIGKH